MRPCWLVLLAACSSTSPGTTPTDSGGEATTDGSSDGSTAASRCTGTETLTCTSHDVQVGGRTVRYEVPLGDPPAAGWPVVVFYQGSAVPGIRAFSATMGATFGQYELTSTFKALLDRGYAVLAPNAMNNGSLYWQTNLPQYANNWTGCPDDVFIHALLDAMAGGTFGPLDPDHRYAMGISSGGFMTSRMAVSYAGTFRALAIASASYATCGPTCTVPALPTDHPPTLFLHGQMDNVVPISSMTPYRDALGSKATAIINATAGHEWLPEAVAAIPDFFAAH